jgi:hypothetical protein
MLTNVAVATLGLAKVKDMLRMSLRPVQGKQRMVLGFPRRRPLERIISVDSDIQLLRWAKLVSVINPTAR